AKGAFRGWKLLWVFLVVVLLYFTHPIVFLLSGLTAGLLAIGYLLQEKKLKPFLIRIGICIMYFVPLLLLMLLFLNRQDDIPFRLESPRISGYLNNWFHGGLIIYLKDFDPGF